MSGPPPPTPTPTPPKPTGVTGSATTLSTADTAQAYFCTFQVDDDSSFGSPVSYHDTSSGTTHSVAWVPANGLNHIRARYTTAANDGGTQGPWSDSTDASSFPPRPVRPSATDGDLSSGVTAESFFATFQVDDNDQFSSPTNYYDPLSNTLHEVAWSSSSFKDARSYVRARLTTGISDSGAQSPWSPTLTYPREPQDLRISTNIFGMQTIAVDDTPSGETYYATFEYNYADLANPFGGSPPTVYDTILSVGHLSNLQAAAYDLRGIVARARFTYGSGDTGTRGRWSETIYKPPTGIIASASGTTVRIQLANGFPQAVNFELQVADNSAFTNPDQYTTGTLTPSARERDITIVPHSGTNYARVRYSWENGYMTTIWGEWSQTTQFQGVLGQIVHEDHYTTRNVLAGLRNPVGLDENNFTGPGGMGLDAAFQGGGVKSIYGKRRGLRQEGILNGNHATRLYPGMIIHLTSLKALAAGVGAIPSRGNAIIADPLMGAYEIGYTGTARATQDSVLALVAVEDDLIGRGPAIPYLAGMRVQAECFNPGDEIWAAVKCLTTGDMTVGTELELVDEGYFQQRGAVGLNVDAVLLQQVKQSNRIPGLVEDPLYEYVALARVILA